MRALSVGFALCVLALGAAEVADDFSQGLAQWEPLLANYWEIRPEGDESRLVLLRPGEQRPPLRRPSQFVLLKGEPWWDVTIEADIRTLRPDSVTGRDICVLFGYRDDTHFYYAHLCSDSNGGTHNVIVKVEGNTRRAIMRERRPPVRLTSAWHRVRVTHASDGEIRVFLDDMNTPLMTARDVDYPVGRIGFGAFDDPAMFGNVRISGQRLDEHPGSERVLLFEAENLAGEWRETLPVPAGDGQVIAEYEARRDPAKGDTPRPSGWWRFLEYQDEAGSYLTGSYGGDQLEPEIRTYTDRAYLPARVAQVRVGLGQKNQDFHAVRSLKVWHERPTIELVEPLPGANVPDSTPRFAWRSAADRLTVEVAAEPDFTQAAAVAVENTRLLEWPSPLAPGVWHWRVRNADGVVSEARSFTQTATLDQDRQSPKIRVESTFLPQTDSGLPVTLAAGEDSTGMHIEATVNALAANVEPTEAGWLVRPVKGWSQGLNRVIVRAVDPAGNAAEARAYVTHASPAPPRVEWTRHHGVRIDGEPFFPIAMYMVRETELPLARAAGYNLVQHYGADNELDSEKTRAWLQSAQANDLRAFVALNRARLQAGDLDFVAERVGALLAEPALLAWYLFDEPELVRYGLRPHALARVKHLISALDPFHPVLLTCYHEHYLDEYADCYDVFLTQAYHPDPAKVWNEAKTTRAALAVVDRAGAVIVNNYLPTQPLEVVRAGMHLAAMTQSGVIAWGWWDDYRIGQLVKAKTAFAERFAELPDAERKAALAAEAKTLAEEIAALAPLFTAPGDPEVLEADGVLVWTKTIPPGGAQILLNLGNTERTVPLERLADNPAEPVTLAPYEVRTRRW